MLIIYLVILFLKFEIGVVSYMGTKLITHIISNREVEQIEKIFLQTTTSIVENTSDPVCNLNKEQKIDLCERIFTIGHYNDDLKIYLGKIAFFVTSMNCEIKTVRLRTEHKTKDKQNISKRMYPCYGRHDPVQTSIIEDNYYAKFYLSAGPTIDSVFVYKYEYDDRYDWFSVYDYLQNVELKTLVNLKIKLKEVGQELRKNKDKTVNSNMAELRDIFYREDGYYKTDPVCEMNQYKKIALCQLLFKQHLCSTFMLRFNENAFHIFQLECSEKRIQIDLMSDSQTVSKRMYPCFSQSRFDNANIFKIDKSIKPIYVSGGPRRNSVYVYSNFINGKNVYEIRLLQMYENIRIHDLIAESYAYDCDFVTTYVETMKLLFETIKNNEILKSNNFRILMETKRNNKIKEIMNDPRLDKAQRQKKIDELNHQIQSDTDKVIKKRIDYIVELTKGIDTGDEIFSLEELHIEIEKNKAIFQTLENQWKYLDPGEQKSIKSQKKKKEK